MIGHDGFMKETRIANLKARLSSYLGYVREEGEEVLVYDRRTPIARILPVESSREKVTIDEAQRPVADLFQVKPVRPRKRISSTRILKESRDQR